MTRQAARVSQYKRMKNNIRLGQCQLVLPFSGCESNLDSMDVLRLKFRDELLGVSGAAENQQPTRRLRIEKHIAYFRRHIVADQNILSEEIPIAPQTTGAKTFPAVIQRAWQEWKRTMIELDRNAAGFRDFAGVAREAESSDVRHRNRL